MTPAPGRPQDGHPLGGASHVHPQQACSRLLRIARSRHCQRELGDVERRHGNQRDDPVRSAGRYRPGHSVGHDRILPESSTSIAGSSAQTTSRCGRVTDPAGGPAKTAGARPHSRLKAVQFCTGSVRRAERHPAPVPHGPRNRPSSAGCTLCMSHVYTYPPGYQEDV